MRGPYSCSSRRTFCVSATVAGSGRGPVRYGSHGGRNGAAWAGLGGALGWAFGCAFAGLADDDDDDDEEEGAFEALTVAAEAAAAAVGVSSAVSSPATSLLWAGSGSLDLSVVLVSVLLVLTFVPVLAAAPLASTTDDLVPLLIAAVAAGGGGGGAFPAPSFFAGAV